MGAFYVCGNMREALESKLIIHIRLMNDEWVNIWKFKDVEISFCPFCGQRLEETPVFY
jgi:hypothetical protein